VAGRAGKAIGRTPVMYETGNSDRPVVPTKPVNKVTTTAESVEGRGLAKGNTGGHTRPGHRAGPARLVGSTVYVKQQQRTSGYRSRRSYTTSMSTDCVRRSPP
jgi:hypothetical protein